jgi:hypothetical protein
MPINMIFIGNIKVHSDGLKGGKGNKTKLYLEEKNIVFFKCVTTFIIPATPCAYTEVTFTEEIKQYNVTASALIRKKIYTKNIKNSHKIFDI